MCLAVNELIKALLCRIIGTKEKCALLPYNASSSTSAVATAKFPNSKKSFGGMKFETHERLSTPRTFKISSKKKF